MVEIVVIYPLEEYYKFALMVNTEAYAVIHVILKPWLKLLVVNWAIPRYQIRHNHVSIIVNLQQFTKINFAPYSALTSAANPLTYNVQCSGREERLVDCFTEIDIESTGSCSSIVELQCQNGKIFYND